MAGRCCYCNMGSFFICGFFVVVMCKGGKHTENKNLIVVLTFTTNRIKLSDFPINFSVLSVVTTIGIEVICVVKFNTVQFKFSDALLKRTTNSVTSVKN